MTAKTQSISPLLSGAIVAWSGWGVSPMPKRSDERVIAQFGTQAAQELLPVIRSLEVDFYAPASEIRASDLDEMGKVASKRFREKHPGISEEIIKILAWCFNYDYR